MIVPIVNETSLSEAEKKLEQIKLVTKRVQIDVEDGLFVDRLTIGPKDLVDYDFDGLEVEYHLMVDDPTEWIEECVEARAKKIIGQVERMGSQGLFVDEVENTQGVEAGLALEFATPIESIEKDLLEKVKTILLLAVSTGPSGSALAEGIYEKIKKLRKVYEGTIFVDGGMNPMTYRRVREAGADEAGASSYLWQGELKTNYREFEK